MFEHFVYTPGLTKIIVLNSKRYLGIIEDM